MKWSAFFFTAMSSLILSTDCRKSTFAIHHNFCASFTELNVQNQCLHLPSLPSFSFLIYFSFRPNSSVITTIPAIEGLSDRNISNPRGSPHLERNRISTTSDHSNHCDYDYLIQTRRNMEELNETITRISAANESQLQDVQVSDIDSRNLSPNSSHVTSRSVETLPHTTQALNTNGSVTNNPRGSGDSLFYSVHSVNRRTSPIRNNDPCAQQ